MPRQSYAILFLAGSIVLGGCQHQMGEFGWHEIDEQHSIRGLVRKDYTPAHLKKLNLESDKGTGSASLELFSFYAVGETTHDAALALSFLNKAARQGDSTAQRLIREGYVEKHLGNN